MSFSTLHQVMVGRGLAVATQEKVAFSGWTTVRSNGAWVMLGGTGRREGHSVELVAEYTVCIELLLDLLICVQCLKLTIDKQLKVL